MDVKEIEQEIERRNPMSFAIATLIDKLDDESAYDATEFTRSTDMNDLFLEWYWKMQDIDLSKYADRPRECELAMKLTCIILAATFIMWTADTSFVKEYLELIKQPVDELFDELIDLDEEA